MLAIISAMLILVALAHALWAAKPARFYGSQELPKEFFLISYVASIKSSEFVDIFRGGTLEDLETWMLEAIHGKARHAHKKFRFPKGRFSGHADQPCILSVRRNGGAVYTRIMHAHRAGGPKARAFKKERWHLQDLR
jgi:hypothetical protein